MYQENHGEYHVDNTYRIGYIHITARAWGLPGLATSVRASQNDDDDDDYYYCCYYDDYDDEYDYDDDFDIVLKPYKKP